jgi:hypothetical protein
VVTEARGESNSSQRPRFKSSFRHKKAQEPPIIFLNFFVPFVPFCGQKRSTGANVRAQSRKEESYVLAILAAAILTSGATRAEVFVVFIHVSRSFLATELTTAVLTTTTTRMLSGLLTALTASAG